MQASIRSSIHQGLRPRQPTQRRVPAAYLCQGQRGGWSQALGLRLDLAALMNDDGVHGAAHSRLAALLVLRGAGEPVTRGGDPSHLWDPPHTDCLGQPRCLKLEKQGPPNSVLRQGHGQDRAQGSAFPATVHGNGTETLSVGTAGTLTPGTAPASPPSERQLWARGQARPTQGAGQKGWSLLTRQPELWRQGV